MIARDWKVRFWESIKKGDCWEWQKSCDRRGYGVLKVGRLMKTCSRLSWILHYGEIPPGLFVLHRCDNRKCVRPEHLFLGTNKENMDDRDQKGRNTKGELVPQHKVTVGIVRAIRAEYASGSIGQKELGVKYGIVKQTVSRIIRKESWAHVNP